MVVEAVEKSEEMVEVGEVGHSGLVPGGGEGRGWDSRTGSQGPEVVVGGSSGVPTAPDGHWRRKYRRGRKARSEEETQRAEASSPVDLPEFSFRAVLAEGRSFLQISNDGSAKVVLEVPASDLPAVLKLVLFQNKVIRINVTPEVLPKTPYAFSESAS